MPLLFDNLENFKKKFKNIKIIGFDMDSTLVNYKPTYYEMLFNILKDNMVKILSEKILDGIEWQYKLHPMMTEGLIFLRKMGLFILVDKEGFVTSIYFGTRRIDLDDKNNGELREIINCRSRDDDVNFTIDVDFVYAFMLARLIDKWGEDVELFGDKLMVLELDNLYKVLRCKNLEEDKSLYDCCRIEEITNIKLIKCMESFYLWRCVKDCFFEVFEDDIITKELNRDVYKYVEYDGVEKIKILIKRLKNVYKFFIVSNNNRENVDILLKQLFIEDVELFELVITRADKPNFFCTFRNKDICDFDGDDYGKILKHFKILPENVLYVGNELEGDVLAPQRVGFQTAFIYPTILSCNLIRQDVRNRIGCKCIKKHVCIFEHAKHFANYITADVPSLLSFFVQCNFDEFEMNIKLIGNFLSFIYQSNLCLVSHKELDFFFLKSPIF